MADMHHYTIAISQIISTPTDEDVVVLGLRLSDFIQNARFAEAAFRMLAGHMPSKIVAHALHTSGQMPGFGIPAHATDPRAPALLKVAQESGAAGSYCRFSAAIERALAKVKGRLIPINLDRIVTALVLDCGFPMGCAKAFVMIPRSFSTLAHHLEEKARNTRWRHVPQEYVTYAGSLPGDDIAIGSEP